MSVADMNDRQLLRLERKCWERMTAGDGYQPFGYDERTLRIAKPRWLDTLTTIRDELRKRGCYEYCN